MAFANLIHQGSCGTCMLYLLVKFEDAVLTYGGLAKADFVALLGVPFEGVLRFAILTVTAIGALIAMRAFCMMGSCDRECGPGAWNCGPGIWHHGI